MLNGRLRHLVAVVFVTAAASAAVVAIVVGAWAARPWLARPASTPTERTGRFGGDCMPAAGSSTICFCNDGRSVCAGGETYANGVGLGARPPVGTRITVRIERLDHAGIGLATVVALTPE